MTVPTLSQQMGETIADIRQMQKKADEYETSFRVMLDIQRKGEEERDRLRDEVRSLARELLRKETCAHAPMWREFAARAASDATDPERRDRYKMLIRLAQQAGGWWVDGEFVEDTKGTSS